MNLQDLNDLDLSNIGNWPWVAKIVIIFFACALIAGGVFYFDTMPQLEKREQLAKQEVQKFDILRIRAEKAAKLEAYKKQLAYMQGMYHKMRLRLPTKTQVAVLLEDISQKGRAAGLEFKLFDPQVERKNPGDDFIELPIQVQVVGNYHQLGQFVSDLAELPRIVTLHDINIVSGKNKAGVLHMSVLAKTYKYEEEKGVGR